MPLKVTFTNQVVQISLAVKILCQIPSWLLLALFSALFPKVSKCSFKKYGPSGDIIKDDVICLLPLNVVYEKILIWIW